MTDTLTVADQALLGGVQIDGTASTVTALDGTLAYVADTEDISIVDVSNPASPQVLSTFGSSDINQGGTNLVQLAGNDLIVASQNPSGGSFNLIIYSLTNPNSPQLASNTTIPYASPVGLLVQGNTVFVPTAGFNNNGNGGVRREYGDILAIDISNPAAPVLAGSLFNGLGTPDGGDGNQNAVITINNQTAYVAGSTSTGTKPKRERASPDRRHGQPEQSVCFEPACDPRDRAGAGCCRRWKLRAGRGEHGGWLNPYNETSDIGLTGNVALEHY